MQRSIRSGYILELARAAGIRLKRKSMGKVPILCPFHDDRTPSAVLFESNVFHCPVCTPGGGLSARDFAARLGIDRNLDNVPRIIQEAVIGRGRPRRLGNSSEPSMPNQAVDQFSAEHARNVWQLARNRARSDAALVRDRAAYDYLAARGLSESWELALFGVLHEEMQLPASIAWWPRSGYRVIAPLFGHDGSLRCVQARAIGGQTPKTLFPAGSRASGTAFASPRGLALLRGQEENAEDLVLAEGLTDYLALATYSPVPVLAAPGTGMCVSMIGPWVAGRTLLLALDVDAAGESAVDQVARVAHGHGCARVVRVVWPGAAKDACQTLAALGAIAFEDLLVDEIARWEHAA